MGEKGASFVCKGTVASVPVNGEAEITVSEDGFALASLFDSTRAPWSDVTGLRYADYTVYVQTRAAAFAFSKLGYDAEPLYDHMLAAYCDKVRKCLFIDSGLLAKAKGDAGATRGVPIEVYEDCVVSLPPDLNAKRVPLSFVNGFRDQDYTLWISVIDGTQASYSKLGYDHAPVSKAIQDAIKNLREKTIRQVSAIDPAISADTASRLAKLMPEGIAAPIGTITSIAPSFAAALEDRIAQSRAAETYKVFQDISGADAVCVGFRANNLSFGDGDGDGGGDGAGGGDRAGGGGDRAEAGKGGAGGGLPGGDSSGMAGVLGGMLGGGGDSGMAGALGGMLGGGGDSSGMAGALGGMLGGGGDAEGGESSPDPFIPWLIAPTPSGNACAVEFAGATGESAATFVYRFSGPWDAFRLKLGIALEAIAWKREIIRLTDEELADPAYADYRMANDRNEALRFVRGCFAGRALHHSMDSWRKQVTDLLGIQ